MSRARLTRRFLMGLEVSERTRRHTQAEAAVPALPVEVQEAPVALAVVALVPGARLGHRSPAPRTRAVEAVVAEAAAAPG